MDSSKTLNGTGTGQTATDKAEEEIFKEKCPPLNVVDAPVFRPTEEEFKDPLAYLHSIYDTAEKSGICKIIPPSSWSPPFCIEPDSLSFSPRMQPLSLLEAKQRLWHLFHFKLDGFWSMFAMRVKHPIIFRDVTVELPDLYYHLVEPLSREKDLEMISIEEWKKIALKLKFQSFDAELAEHLKDIYKNVIAPMDDFVAKLANLIKQFSQQQGKDYGPAAKKRRMMAGARRNAKKMMKAAGNSNNSLADAEGFNFDQFNTARVDLGICRKCRVNVNKGLLKTVSCLRCKLEFHEVCIEKPTTKSTNLTYRRHLFQCPSCTAHRLHYDPLVTFGFQDSPKIMTLEDYADYADSFKASYFGVDDLNQVSERKVEEEFWKNILIPDSHITVLYGADLHSKNHGSGFPVSKKEDVDAEDEEEDDDLAFYKKSGWNLNNLPNLKSSILRHIGSDVSGMTQPWIYVGMVFSAFCWHTEDHWTPSINYLHLGDTKTWYGIPGSQAANVDERMRQYVPPLFRIQPDLMHNLNTMLHPYELTKVGIPVCRADQHAGEFIVTFPRAYHAGFNNGFNCAEAVNFATSRWLNFGFESINHYITLKRNNVFSHEELLSTLAASPDTLSLREAEETSVQLSILISDEQDFRAELTRMGLVRKRRVLFEKIEDDARSCFNCSKTLFFSAVYCSCRSSLPAKQRLSCGKHFRMLCRCAVAKKTLQFRYTMEELENLLEGVCKRVKEIKPEQN